MDNFWLLAQAATDGELAPAAPETATKTEATGAETTPKQPRPKGIFDSGIIWVLMMMFVVIYFVMMRPQKKKQQQHKQMLDNLKKNDRVRSIGGIIGTVVDVRNDEVVVKIDEASNTKIRFQRSAIGTVITGETQEK
ncbi:MAG: preprotein translocase subunit YajC [Sedimentisphaerales bacterium]|nr:preprotein translocase subunit YajC [Sedimentisphaerales bacterium]